MFGTNKFACYKPATRIATQMRFAGHLEHLPWGLGVTLKETLNAKPPFRPA